MLSVILAYLNHALQLPPFSLLLVSLCMSDGTHFHHDSHCFDQIPGSDDAHVLLPSPRYRVMATNW